jgi:threonine dehydrogenase-like Zn-dependent dehydrogenase
MKTKAVRLYGKNDLRLEEFVLPNIRDDEILAQIISDSICMSSYKATVLGSEHKRIPKDVSENPVIIGHEFCGVILEAGPKWKSRFQPGMKFTIQPALNLKQNPCAAPGYSFRYIGGDATHIVIPNEAMEQGCLLEYKGDAYFHGSLSEPMSCIIGAFHECYHTEGGSHVHQMGIRKGGKMAILAGVGPMGLGAIDYAIHTERKPSLLVVTDVDEARLARAALLYTADEARKNGIELVYLNASKTENPVDALMQFSEGTGYDDVFVFTPVKPVVEQGDKILGKDGCLNFFAGPTNPAFSAELNFYNIHYNASHIIGTTGGNTDDMMESLQMMAAGKINPASMITHVGGLDSVVHATMNLPDIPGGKKLIYTNISMELTAISDFREKGRNDPMMAGLAEIVEASNGLWSPEAEKYLLQYAKAI